MQVYGSDSTHARVKIPSRIGEVAPCSIRRCATIPTRQATNNADVNQPDAPQTAVALIIPSLDGHVEALLESVRCQTLQPAEIAVVRGVRPNGKARNQGVAQTTAPILLFVDDDAVLGDKHAIANLVAPLTDPTIGIAGASKLLPPNAPPFQRWVAREVARTVHAVVQAPLETNPDPPAFYSEVTTTCCAMRREVFYQAGRFDEHLVRGVDTEFFVRVRRSTLR